MTTTTEKSLADIRDDINFKMLRNDRLTLDEICIIGAVDQEVQVAEKYRCSVVLHNQSLAGTAAERDENKRELADAKAQLAREAPKIAAAIAELQSQQRELEREAKVAAALVDAQTRAVAQLRKHVPPHVAKYHHNMAALLCQQYPQRPELQDRIRQIRSLMAIDIETLEGRNRAKLYANRNKPDLLDSEKHGHIQGTLVSTAINPQRWHTHITQLAADLPVFEGELAAQDRDYAAQKEEVDKILDHYVK